MKAQRVRLSAVLLSIALAIAIVLPATLAPPVYSAPEDAPIAGETIEGVRGVTESMASINARQMMYDAMGGRILR